MNDTPTVSKLHSPVRSVRTNLTATQPETQFPRVSKQARLFRAGEYSDKNAIFTAADLDVIVARFEDAGGEVPLRIEHTDTVLDPLGTVTGIYRRGTELLGTVNLPEPIAAHLFARDTPLHLSVNLERGEEEPGYRLIEVSLVREGRVDGAGFVEDDAPPASLPAGGDADAIGAVFARFRREGKLSPAMETPLRELLTDTGVARFTRGDAPALDALTRLLSAVPVFRTMTTAPNSSETLTVLSSPLLTGDAAPVSAVLASVCARWGVSVADAARYF